MLFSNIYIDHLFYSIQLIWLAIELEIKSDEVFKYETDNRHNDIEEDKEANQYLSYVFHYFHFIRHLKQRYV